MGSGLGLGLGLGFSTRAYTHSRTRALQSRQRPFNAICFDTWSDALRHISTSRGPGSQVATSCGPGSQVPCGSRSLPSMQACPSGWCSGMGFALGVHGSQPAPWVAVKRPPIAVEPSPKTCTAVGRRAGAAVPAVGAPSDARSLWANRSLAMRLLRTCRSANPLSGEELTHALCWTRSTSSRNRRRCCVRRPAAIRSERCKTSRSATAKTAKSVSSELRSRGPRPAARSRALGTQPARCTAAALTSPASPRSASRPRARVALTKRRRCSSSTPTSRNKAASTPASSSSVCTPGSDSGSGLGSVSSSG